mgnify:CR=1 FL=1
MTQEKLLGKRVKIAYGDGNTWDAEIIGVFHQDLHKTMLKLVSVFGHEFILPIDEVIFTDEDSRADLAGAGHK